MSDLRAEYDEWSRRVGWSIVSERELARDVVLESARIVSRTPLASGAGDLVVVTGTTRYGRCVRRRTSVVATRATGGLLGFITLHGRELIDVVGALAEAAQDAGWDDLR